MKILSEMYQQERLHYITYPESWHVRIKTLDLDRIGLGAGLRSSNALVNCICCENSCNNTHKMIVLS